MHSSQKSLKVSELKLGSASFKLMPIFNRLIIATSRCPKKLLSYIEIYLNFANSCNFLTVKAGLCLP